MRITLPASLTGARFTLIGYGLILLVWMGFEDRGVVAVTLLGTGGTLVVAVVLLLARFAGQTLSFRTWFAGAIVMGMIVGGLSPLTTALLMFFKSAWHAHIYPDYPPLLIISMLERIPIWAISGAFFGLGLSILMHLRLSRMVRD